MNDFKRTLLICWFGVFTTSMGLSQIAPILPLYIQELGYHDFKEISFYSGLAFGIMPLFMALFSPLWAYLGARYGYKSMLLRASFGMAVLNFWLSFVQSPMEIVLVRALTGIISGFGSTAVVFIAVIAPKNQVAYALGVLSTATISGSLIGPLFAGLVAEIINIRTVFGCVSFLIACSFITVYFFIRETKIQKECIKGDSFIKEDKLLIILLFFTTFIIQMGTFGSMPMLGIFVGKIYHGDHIIFLASIVVATSGISNLFFAPKIGKIADKIGPIKIIFWSLIFCGFCFYLQSLVDNVLTLIIVRLLIGIGLGGLLPCVNALLKKIVSSGNLSVILGFNQTFQFLGNFLGAFGAGLMASYVDVEIVFVFICGIFILNAIIFFILKRSVIFSKKDLLIQ